MYSRFQLSSLLRSMLFLQRTPIIPTLPHTSTTTTTTHNAIDLVRPANAVLSILCCMEHHANHSNCSRSSNNILKSDSSSSSYSKPSDSTAIKERRGNFRFDRATIRGLRPDQIAASTSDKKKEDRRKGDWDCAFCGAVNYKHRMRCKDCSREKEDSDEENGMPIFRDDKKGRSDSTAKGGDWTCPEESCGALNFSRRIECIQCKVPRPGSTGSRAGDWTCNNCSHLNFARRAECQRCNCVKDAPAEGQMEGGGDMNDINNGYNNNRDEYRPPRSRAGYGGRGGRGGGRGGSRGNDWECESCGILNFGFRTECKQCGLGKQ